MIFKNFERMRTQGDRDLPWGATEIDELDGRFRVDGHCGRIPSAIVWYFLNAKKYSISFSFSYEGKTWTDQVVIPRGIASGTEKSDDDEDDEEIGFDEDPIPRSELIEAVAGSGASGLPSTSYGYTETERDDDGVYRRFNFVVIIRESTPQYSTGEVGDPGWQLDLSISASASFQDGVLAPYSYASLGGSDKDSSQNSFLKFGLEELYHTPSDGDGTSALDPEEFGSISVEIEVDETY